MKNTISFLLILLTALCLAGHSRAYDAVVLKGVNIKPYNDALKGFQSSCGCSVRTFAVDADVSGLVINRRVVEKPGIRLNAKTIGRDGHDD